MRGDSSCFNRCGNRYRTTRDAFFCRLFHRSETEKLSPRRTVSSPSLSPSPFSAVGDTDRPRNFEKVGLWASRRLCNRRNRVNLETACRPVTEAAPVPVGVIEMSWLVQWERMFVVFFGKHPLVASPKRRAILNHIDKTVFVVVD